MNKIQAAALHLALSAVVASGLFVAMWFVWYPEPLFVAMGGVNVFVLLLAVDVTLGPLLTLIVFSAGKKNLQFDLTVIALIQVFALGYGVYTLLAVRPAFLAALGHRFDVVAAGEIVEDEPKAAQVRLSWRGPVWVGTRRSDNPLQQEKILLLAMQGLDYGHFPQHHQPIENMRDEILKNAQPISDLKKLNPGEEVAIDKWLAKRDVTEESVRYQGLKARAKDMAVIVDAKTAKVIGIAPFKPWE